MHMPGRMECETASTINVFLFKTTKKLGKFDLFVSFRSSLRSKLMKFCISSKRKYQFDKIKFNKGHQVEKYTQFINIIINIHTFKLTLV